LIIPRKSRGTVFFAVDGQTIVFTMGLMATLKDIARQTDFSVAVVSRALNPRPGLRHDRQGEAIRLD
jgi:hypothetical protein